MYTEKTITAFLIIFSLCFNIGHSQINKNETNVGISANGAQDTLTIDDNLEDTVAYEAQTISNDFPNKTTYLLTDAEVTYQDIVITADYIMIHWDTDEVSAYSKIDSTGKVLERATFSQGGKEYQYESFRYNFKNQKGIVYNGRTIESDLVIDANVSKRVNDSVYFMRNAVVTGDEYYKLDKDTVSDYHILMNRAKFIQDEALIAGSSQLYIEQVPTPLFLPFLYVPIKGERSAGIIIPSFGEVDRLGFFLQGFGVYTPIGQYFDLEVTGDLYSKGTKGVHGRSSYKKNYKYSGNITIDFENRREGIKGITTGIDAYNANNNFRVSWSHSQDRKANPNLIFRANVSYSSSKFYRQSVNLNNTFNGDFMNNTSNSSISIDKYFNDFPMNISFSTTLNQNFNTEQANLSLPMMNANLSRQYPLKNSSNVPLFKKFFFDYRMNLQNQMNGLASEIFSSETFDSARSGMKNAFGIGTGTNLLNYFAFNFGGNYDEIWYLKTIEKYYDEESQTVESIDVKGFSTFRTYSFNSSLSTVLYGTLLFSKDKRIQGIRHTIQPSISYSLRPDFSESRFGYYDTYIDAEGNEKQYSRFEGGVYGSPSQGLQNNVGFNIGNNLEMKIRSKSDSIGVKKIKIFDYLNLNGSYNMAADSLRMSNISINGSTSFWENKFKLNYSAQINPYRIEYENEVDETGELVDKLGYFSVSNYNISLNFSLNNAFFGESIDYASKYPKTGRVRYEEYYFDEANYAHFNTPWNASVGLQYRSSRGLNRTASENISARVSGRVSPSPYWQISGSANYDFVNKELGFTQFNFTRDLRSFLLTFSWVPFGSRRSWSFAINIKTSVLRDVLKYDDRDYNNTVRPF